MRCSFCSSKFMNSFRSLKFLSSFRSSIFMNSFRSSIFMNDMISAIFYSVVLFKNSLILTDYFWILSQIVLLSLIILQNRNIIIFFLFVFQNFLHLIFFHVFRTNCQSCCSVVSHFEKWWNCNNFLSSLRKQKIKL